MLELSRDLEKARGHWPKLAEQVRLDHSTIARIARGEHMNPTMETYQRIRDWLDAKLPLIQALESDDPLPPTQQQAAYEGPDRRSQMA